MKRILNVNKTAASTDIALLVARIGIAALMLTHGVPKLIMLFSGAPVQFPAVMGLSAELSLGLVVLMGAAVVTMAQAGKKYLQVSNSGEVQMKNVLIT